MNTPRRPSRRTVLVGIICCTFTSIWYARLPKIQENITAIDSYTTLPPNVIDGRWAAAPLYDDGPCLIPTPDKPVDIYAALRLKIDSSMVDSNQGKYREVRWPVSMALRILPMEVLKSGIFVGDAVRFVGRPLDPPVLATDPELVTVRAVVVGDFGIVTINIDAR